MCRDWASASLTANLAPGTDLSASIDSSCTDWRGRYPDLHRNLLAARAEPEALSARDESELIVGIGPHLDRFLAALFDIEAETEAANCETLALDPIHSCKRLFVQRRAVKTYPDASEFDGPALRSALETIWRVADRTLLRPACDALGQVRRRRGTGPGDALRRLGDADGRRARRQPGNTLFRVPRSLTRCNWYG